MNFKKPQEYSHQEDQQSEKKKQKKMNGFVYVLGSVALAATMFKITPTLIDVISEYLYKKNYNSMHDLDESDYEPVVVKTSDLEDT